MALETVKIELEGKLTQSHIELEHRKKELAKLTHDQEHSASKDSARGGPDYPSQISALEQQLSKTRSEL